MYYRTVTPLFAILLIVALIAMARPEVQAQPGALFC
jgi:hypothetical protein